MARTKLVNGIAVKLTEREEVLRDAEEAAWTTSEPTREESRRLEAYKLDKDMPSLEEKIEALLQFVKTSDSAELDAIDAKIVKLKLKHGVT